MITILAAAPLVVAAIIGSSAGGSAVATSTTGSSDFTYVTVASGESLWAIAEAIAPTADPREVVADIVDLNQLRSADVAAGEQLAIPLEYTD